MTDDKFYHTHDGVFLHQIRRFGTTCFVHVIDLKLAKIKLVSGFSRVDSRAVQLGSQLAFNCNGWGSQFGNPYIPNEQLVIEGQIIQAFTIAGGMPCMNISKDGKMQILNKADLLTSYNVIGFDRKIAVSGIYNTQITNTSLAPRTIYGIDIYGNMVVLVCEGRTSTERGLSFAECWEVMKEFNVTDCGNGDGGYSSASYNDNAGGLLNKSYEVEYRETVMQVLFYANKINQVTPIETPLPEGEKSMFKGTVLVTLNLRPTPNGIPVIFQMRLNDKVEASSIDPNGWWKITRVTRNGSDMQIPSMCYAQQGLNNTYIRLDSTVVVPPPVEPPVPPVIVDDPYVKAILVTASGKEEIWLPQV